METTSDRRGSGCRGSHGSVGAPIPSVSPIRCASCHHHLVCHLRGGAGSGRGCGGPQVGGGWGDSTGGRSGHHQGRLARGDHLLRGQHPRAGARDGRDHSEAGPWRQRTLLYPHRTKPWRHLEQHSAIRNSRFAVRNCNANGCCQRAGHPLCRCRGSHRRHYSHVQARKRGCNSPGTRSACDRWHPNHGRARRSAHASGAHPYPRGRSPAGAGLRSLALGSRPRGSGCRHRCPGCPGEPNPPDHRHGLHDGTATRFADHAKRRDL